MGFWARTGVFGACTGSLGPERGIISKGPVGFGAVGFGAVGFLDAEGNLKVIT